MSENQLVEEELRSSKPIEHEILSIHEGLWEELCSKSGPSRYTPEDKIKAIQVYYATGSSWRTEAVTGIPSATIRQWKTMPWWDAVKKEVLKLNNEKLSIMLTNTAMLAAEKLQDRVEHGEPVFDKEGNPKMKDGKQVRVPLTVHQLAIDGVAIPLEKVMKFNLIGDNVKEKMTAEQFLREIRDTLDAAASKRRLEEKVINGEVEEDD